MQSSQSSQSSAIAVYTLLHSKECPLDIAEVLEEVYKSAEYPGNAVVRNVVSFMNLDRDSFTKSLGIVKNSEWYLSHIAVTLENYIKYKMIIPVQEWM